MDDVKDVAELPGVLGCDGSQLHADIGGSREYDHAHFLREAGY